jgi:hypothetical protein
VPHGTVKSSELENEGGKLIYSFDIEVTGKSGIEEVNIDAMTGDVLAVEHEDAKKEQEEAREEARAKKKPVRGEKQEKGEHGESGESN